MASGLEDYPKWAQRALQGVAYWIGHRRCLYRGYPLSEGALVAEICNLIHANLREHFVLQCEVQYSQLLDGKPKPDILRARARADIVVAEETNTAADPEPKFIIEVKRASAPSGQIKYDLQRLAAVRHAHPGIRAFLFVVSEANRPVDFVDEEGKSILGRKPIPGSTGHYRVRRTWKAAHAFRSRDRAQYACLLEVYGN